MHLISQLLYLQVEGGYRRRVGDELELRGRLLRDDRLGKLYGGRLLLLTPNDVRYKLSNIITWKHSKQVLIGGFIIGGSAMPRTRVLSMPPFCYSPPKKLREGECLSVHRGYVTSCFLSRILTGMYPWFFLFFWGGGGGGLWVGVTLYVLTAPQNCTESTWFPLFWIDKIPWLFHYVPHFSSIFLNENFIQFSK